MTGRCDARGDDNGTDLRAEQNFDIGKCLFSSMLPHEAMVNVLISLFVVLTLLSLLVNCFTMYSLGSSEDLSWEPRFILLKNLITCDLLQTLNSGPAVTVALALRRTTSFNTLCLTQYFFGSTCIFCSLIIITFMALERYVYVCHAIHYLVILSKWRLRLGIALTWAVSVCVGSANILLLHRGQPAPRLATLGLFCEPDTVEQHMGFPRSAAVFRKLVGTVVLLFCFLAYSVSYTRMYQDAQNAVVPFNLVNTRARNTVMFYCGMLLLQLLPVFVKVASDALWELEGTSAMLAEEGPSRWAFLLHISLLVLMMVPPCINPLVFGLKNKEVRRALARPVWWQRRESPPGGRWEGRQGGGMERLPLP